MNCVNCGAALPADSAVCTFCQTRNDVDLRGVFAAAVRRPGETRVCPACESLLETLDLGQGGAFLVERCPQCLGMFFDPGELEQVAAEKASPASRVNFARIENLLREETPTDFSEVRYRKCPVCRALMNRRSYGARAGVIVDDCREHGVWLDAGELRRILAWAAAGGPEHSERRACEREVHEARLRRIDRIPSTEAEREEADPRLVAGLDLARVLIQVLGRWRN
jgi:Zn-finger nucleic acid-binding protein